ncbi:MAG: hypothetical protein KGJ86_13825, partial [Chloroflexota bacterium]|nr:hypothetical protein [Chloroflexota bacterium]
MLSPRFNGLAALAAASLMLAATAASAAAQPTMTTVIGSTSAHTAVSPPRPASVAEAPNIMAEASVLMYHHIAIPSPALPPVSAQYFIPPARFDQQMFFLLVNGYSFVTLDDIVNALN